MRYWRDHTSSSPSSFTSFQLRGVELTTSFEDDALLLETSVASDARGFLKARSIVFKVFASESGETRGSRVSDLRLGAIKLIRICVGGKRVLLVLYYMLKICLFKLTRLWLIDFIYFIPDSNSQTKVSRTQNKHRRKTISAHSKGSQRCRRHDHPYYQVWYRRGA